MADGSVVAPTPQTPQRSAAYLLALVLVLAVLGSACSATPSWIPVETSAPAPAPADTAPSPRTISATDSPA